MTSSEAVAPIGPRGVLLHVGPHKTGTTAIQGSLAAAREELAARGVLYPGKTRSQADPARVASGFASPIGSALPPRRHWDELVAEVAAAPGRVVISSEYFDVVLPDRGREIVAELGGDAVDVVITASPLASVMPSSWQQAVRSNTRLSLEDWLRLVFDEPTAKDPAVFWLRQRFDHQVQRWAEVVGPDRVHIVMTDKSQPRRLFDTFEDLLDLPRDFLQPKRSTVNRSFTQPEIELILRINQQIKARKWSPAIQARFVRMGAVRNLQGRRPGPDEPKLFLPAWAVERANEISLDMIAGIEASGVHVIGDLHSLVSPSTNPADDMAPVTSIDMDIAVRAVIGAMRGGGADLLREKYPTNESLKQYPGVSSAPTELLRAELERREGPPPTLLARVRRTLGRFRRRLLARRP